MRIYKNRLKTRNKNDQNIFTSVISLSFLLLFFFFNNIILSQELKMNQAAKTKTTFSVKGTVYNTEDNLPTIGASIVLKNTLNGTETDFDGNFEIENIKEGAILSFHSLGYQIKDIIIEKNQDFLKVFLEEEAELIACQFFGAVDSKSIHKTKRSFWQKIKSIFKKRV